MSEIVLENSSSILKEFLVKIGQRQSVLKKKKIRIIVRTGRNFNEQKSNKLKVEGVL